MRAAESWVRGRPDLPQRLGRSAEPGHTGAIRLGHAVANDDRRFLVMFERRGSAGSQVQLPVTDQRNVRGLLNRRARRAGGVLLVLLVLVSGGVATALASSTVGRGQERLADQAMTQSMNESAGILGNGIDGYENALQDVATALGAGYAQLNARTFAQLSAALTADRLPGATSVSFVVPASDAGVPATQAYWRARGVPTLSLYRTQARAEHQFVVFSRSFSSRAPTPGRDLAQTPATAEALAKSQQVWSFAMGQAHIALRDRGMPAAQQKLSVTMAVPVLDGVGTFRGWIVMGVYADDFLRSILGGRISEHVNLTLTDVDPDAPRTIVQIDTGTAMDEPSLRRGQDLYVGQRLWRLDLQPTTTLLSDGDRRLGRFTPFAGGAFTLLLAALVAVLTGARNRAMDRVDRATAALRSDIERRQEVEEQLRERERELHEMAFHDQLTGLANRGLFYERVSGALVTHAAPAGVFAVLFIDLDGFKEVNDRHGHGAGDLVLRVTADRLRSCVRGSDTVARFGGDEFAVLLERLAGSADGPAADACAVADRIVAELRAPIQVGATEVRVSASVGIRLSRPGDDSDTVLRAADLAMYEAKTSGKSQHVLAGG
ncbi:diguanylate cyclase domain-containing protein [Actinoplanes sp. NPDC049265]|uniref:diguanylate cyclase domain-containing protein n=1 Tax=Actinoplanes sp. NPDC049265 TaxID=3363902 RepID=UPI003715BC99